MMETTWVLVADGSRARIFETLKEIHTFSEIQFFDNPEGRASTREINTDAEGRFAQKGGGLQGHTSAPQANAIEHDVELFAKQVAQYLDHARTQARYDKLSIIAPPKFLGLMRHNLGKEVRKLVDQEIARDVSWFDAKDIRNYFEESKQKR